MKKLSLFIFLSTFAACVQAGPIFLDDYESATAGTKMPDGYTPFGSFGKMGVSDTKGDAAAGSMGGYIEIDFQSTEWGAGLAHYGLDLDLTKAVLSVQIKSSEDFAAKDGLIGFRISDADGTVVRTPLTDLYAPKTTFSKFSQAVKNLTTTDEPGTTPGIDLKHITSVGLLFYKREDSTHACRFVFDDLRAEQVK